MNIYISRGLIWVAATALLYSCDDRSDPLELGESVAALTASDEAGAQRLAPWQTSTPEAQGFDSGKLAEALLAIRDQNIHVHSLRLMRHDKVITDASFYPYDGTTVHDLASDTKSVMTTLIGIAVDRGELSLDEPMLSFFPERSIANRTALKERITVRHLVSMSSGLDCTKEGGEATLSAMLSSPDWVQFALDLKAVQEPGAYFSYCSPGMHLLSAILQQATGMKASEYAERYLFGPLRIREHIWPSDPQGYSTGWGDLRIHPHDLAKLGTLWRNHGRWHGRSLISREWVDASVQPLLETREGGFYGYGWWVETSEPASYRADGRGGQYVVVLPALDLVAVTTGGGFDMDQIAPALMAALTNPDEPLPPNPAGLSQLRAAVRSVALSPAPVQVAPLPTLAEQISAKMFALEPNSLGLQTIGLELGAGAEATLHLTLTLADGDQSLSLPVGLDGVYRMTAGDYDLPQGVRGTWTDAQTFVFEYDRIANNFHLMTRLQFSADRVIGQSTELTRGTTYEFQGTMSSP